jgi:hypothetical protein
MSDPYPPGEPVPPIPPPPIPPVHPIPPDQPAPTAYPRRQPWRGWWLPALIGLLLGVLIGCGATLVTTQLWRHDGFGNSRMHEGPFGPRRFGPGGPAGHRFGGPVVRPGVPGGLVPSAQATAQPSPS